MFVADRRAAVALKVGARYTCIFISLLPDTHCTLLPIKAKTAQEILGKLQSGTTAERSDSLRRLAELSVDYTFAQEFINKKGLHMLIEMVESGE